MKIAPLTYTMGGAISICGLDEERGHITGHDARHRIARIASPVLDLKAATLLIDELTFLGDERVVHSIELLANGGTDTADINKMRGRMDDLIESGLVRVATVALCEDASDRDILDALHCGFLSPVPFRHL